MDLNLKNPRKPAFMQRSNRLKLYSADAWWPARLASIVTEARLTLCLLIGLPLSAVSMAQSERNYQQSLSEISKEIKSLSRNLNANKSLLETEQTALLKSEQALADIRSKLNNAQRGIADAGRAIDELNRKQADFKRQQKNTRSALSALIESHYKNGVPSQLKMVLNQENPYAVGRLNNYQAYFSDAITTRFSELEQQIAVSTALRKNHQDKLLELQSLEQEQEFLAKTQLEQNQERRKLVARLDAKVAASETKLKKLNADRKRLNSLIQQLEKQKAELARLERERQEAERRAAEQAKRDGVKPQKPVTRMPRKPVEGGFIKQKGRLDCPVNIAPVTKFGQRVVSSGMRSEGMFFDTKSSVSVRSIFRGQVLFADFLKGFGLLLIVDHGDDHISLYGHNEVLYKKVGDAVATNEVISKSGTTGGLKSHGLYFEVRNNTTPINPKSWCN